MLRMSFVQYLTVSIAIAIYAAGLLNNEGFSQLGTTAVGVMRETVRILNGKSSIPISSFDSIKARALDWTVQAAQVSRFKLLASLNLCLASALLLFNVTCNIFLGELRLIEEYNLRERTVNYVLFKIIFVGALIEPELLELICWASCFVVLGFTKMLASLGHDRFEHIAVAPNITTFTHIRLIALLTVVLACCGSWTYFCIQTFWSGGGPSVVLLLLFECMTCMIMMLQTITKYIVHGIDSQVYNGEWDWRGPLWYFIGFGGDIISLSVSAGHYLHVWSLNGVSINFIDAILFLNIKVTVNNIFKQFSGWQNYRKMMHQLNVAYPDATAEELERMDENCAICLRHLDDAKRLPCNHYFHRACLQRLMENGGTPLCPVCRQPLFNLQPHNHGGAPAVGVHLGGDRRRRRPRVARDVTAHLQAISSLFTDCPELINDPNSTPNLRQGQRMVTRRIRKRFGASYYGGTVDRVWQAEAGSHGRIGVTGPIVMYRINYDDGDREDMEWNELSRLLVGITAVGTLEGTFQATATVAGSSSGGSGRSSRRRRGGDVKAKSSHFSPLKTLIMKNIVPIRLYDWTGRSWLYLFSASTTVEELIQLYSSDRNIPSKTVTLRTFDSKMRTIRTAKLDEELSNLTPPTTKKEGEGNNNINKSSDGDENIVEECQVFAYVDFDSSKEIHNDGVCFTKSDIKRLKEKDEEGDNVVGDEARIL